MAEKWMQNVHPKKGALHRDLGIPLGKKIPKAMIRRAAVGEGKTAARARLALVYAKARHHKSDPSEGTAADRAEDRKRR